MLYLILLAFLINLTKCQYSSGSDKFHNLKLCDNDCKKDGITIWRESSNIDYIKSYVKKYTDSTKDNYKMKSNYLNYNLNPKKTNSNQNDIQEELNNKSRNCRVGSNDKNIQIEEKSGNIIIKENKKNNGGKNQIISDDYLDNKIIEKWIKYKKRDNSKENMNKNKQRKLRQNLDNLNLDGKY